MADFSSYSISRKLTLMNMLVSGSALLFACVAFFAYDRFTVQETLINNLSIQAQIIGSNSVSALVFNDPNAAETTLVALKVSPSISSAAIYTPDGESFAQYSREASTTIPKLPVIPEGQTQILSFQNGHITLTRQIVFKGKPAGSVFIQSDLKELDERLKRYAGISVAVLGISLLAALMMSTILKRSVSEPIVHLASVANIVSRDRNYSLRATPMAKRGELAVLLDAFNQMLSQIQERDGALQRAQSELEQRVQERTDELAAVNKDLEAFSYSVSHDLRAPLRHIDGFSAILTQKYGQTLDPKGQHYLKRIRDGAKQMGQLVDDLLSMARIGRQELVLRTTDLKHLVQSTIRELQPEWEGRQIEWRLAEMPEIECDPNLMKLAFINLLSNAVKYTRRTERAIIEVGQTTQDGTPVIFIRDNGAGFEQEFAHKLFGVFQRLHRAEDFEGTGVGLSTVHRIIQKHGGRIWAKGEVGNGATFFLTVVLARPKATAPAEFPVEVKL